MNLTDVEEQKVIDWYNRYNKNEANLTELRDILFEDSRDNRFGEFKEDGHVSFVDLDSIEVDMDELAERLGLEEGEKPTDDQIEEQKKSTFEDEVYGGSEFYCQHYYLYRLKAGEEIFWVMSLHGDGGYRDDFLGPFDSAEDCLSSSTWCDRNIWD